MPSQNASRDFESQKRDLEAQLDYVAKSSELNANQQRSLNKIVTLFRSSSTLKGSNRMRARKTVEFLTTIRKEAGFALFFLCAFSVPQTRIGILSHSEVLALSKKIQEWWSGTQCPQNLYSMAKAFDEKHPDLFEAPGAALSPDGGPHHLEQGSHGAPNRQGAATDGPQTTDASCRTGSNVQVLQLPAEGGVPFILDHLTAIRALTNQLNGGTTVIWLTMPALGECSPFITFSLSQSVAYETWKESQKNEHDESLSD